MNAFLFGSTVVIVNLFGIFAAYRALSNHVSGAEERLHKHQEWLHNTTTEQAQMKQALEEKHESHQSSEEVDPLLEAARGL